MPSTTTILTFRFSGRALKLEAFDLLSSIAVVLILDLKFRTCKMMPSAQSTSYFMLNEFLF